MVLYHTKNELIRGKEFLHEAFGDAIPDITANTTKGTPRVIKLGDMRLGVFGLVPEGDVTPSGTASGPGDAADRAFSLCANRGLMSLSASLAFHVENFERSLRTCPGSISGSSEIT